MEQKFGNEKKEKSALEVYKMGAEVKKKEKITKENKDNSKNQVWTREEREQGLTGR